MYFIPEHAAEQDSPRSTAADQERHGKGAHGADSTELVEMIALDDLQELPGTILVVAEAQERLLAIEDHPFSADHANGQGL